ncbi:NAD(P)-binding domain protein [Metarhizium album ARSEF 1941]|uniref:NAD(P)-binding domain protein n=1 Tax=Metarhizium album (strain ARSEF 1941) TaxID=1081103 RepID=A0A0B2X5I5_METAS|nr:NAD(P)-binding domain protein [Metarhizium album ARSEF 1941]KHO01644.1 NAD(P)-binding domain protein [Metarhizium album ARSEF 1941]
MSVPPVPTVVIIGAGVIGLSAAVSLQQSLRETPGRRPQILMVAREWPGPAVPGAPHQHPVHSADYASMWAGAHVRPIPATTPQLRREAGWLRRTVARFHRLAAEEPASGVTRTLGLEFLEAPDQSYREQVDAATFARETGLPGFRVLPSAELPDGVALGLEYQTFCINPPVYCEALLRKFLLGGGSTARRDLGSEWEAFGLADDVVLVVNASGAGFGDPKCFPTRGQTVVTDLVHVQSTVTRQNKDGTWSFLIPRFLDGGTVVGGTKEPSDWRRAPCMPTRQRLLEEGLKLEPLAHADGRVPPTRAVGEVGVVADVVGRRPTRHGGMRLELDERRMPRHANGEDVRRRVIHAYGAGGRGYETSWGVADEVVALALPLLNSAGTLSDPESVKGTAD